MRVERTVRGTIRDIRSQMAVLTQNQEAFELDADWGGYPQARRVDAWWDDALRRRTSLERKLPA